MAGYATINETLPIISRTFCLPCGELDLVGRDSRPSEVCAVVTPPVQNATICKVMSVLCGVSAERENVRHRNGVTRV